VCHITGKTVLVKLNVCFPRMRNGDSGLNEATSLVVYDRAQFMVVTGIYLFITMVLSRLLSSQYPWFFFEKTTKEESSCLTSVKVKLVMRALPLFLWHLCGLTLLYLPKYKMAPPSQY